MVLAALKYWCMFLECLGWSGRRFRRRGLGLVAQGVGFRLSAQYRLDAFRLMRLAAWLEFRV